jgi:hypothetical protein
VHLRVCVRGLPIGGLSSCKDERCSPPQLSFSLWSPLKQSEHQLIRSLHAVVAEHSVSCTFGMS